MSPYKKNKESLSTMLLSLYYDEATGEVSVKDEQRKLKFYFSHFLGFLGPVIPYALSIFFKLAAMCAIAFGGLGLIVR